MQLFYRISRHMQHKLYSTFDRIIYKCMFYMCFREIQITTKKGIFT